MMKEEFIKLAQEIKMTLPDDNISDEDYSIVENLYIIMDIDKKDFVKAVKAIGLELLLTRRGRWTYLIKAEEHYNEYLRYIKAKDALDEQQKAVEHSKQIIENYENKIRKS